MPTLPLKMNEQKATGVNLLNSIRNEVGGMYADLVPKADGTLANLREIGNIMMNFEVAKNNFIDALVNRIGRVWITSKLFDNPWRVFKKGLLEYGETVEEIFVNIARGYDYRPDDDTQNPFQRKLPDVLAAFHSMNFQYHYDSTISNDQLRQAFLSWQALTDFIARIIEAVYSGANEDEFIVMKYLLAREILNGNVGTVTIPEVTADSARNVVTTMIAQSNNLTYMSDAYNYAGVATYTNKDDQFFILNSQFAATVDVEVLAVSFNMDKAEFMGHIIGVNTFSLNALETKRLNTLFENRAGYTPLTESEIQQLNTISAVIVDRNYFMIFDNYYNMTQIYDPLKLNWNYFYHTWKTFSVSPFSNAMAFTSQTSGVTSVSVSPGTATVAKGGTAKFTATVVTTGFAPKSVTWSVNGTASTISADGTLSVGAEETEASLTVTATSTYDTEKSGTATVTLQS